MRRPIVRKVLVGILSVVGLYVLWFLLQTIGIPRIAALARTLTLWQIGIIALFPFITFIIAAFRWNVILRTLDARINFWKLVQLNFIGAALSLIAPSFDLAGQTARGFLVKEEGMHRGVAFGSVFMDGWIRIVNNVTFIFLFLAALLLSGKESRQSLVSFWILSLGLAALLLLWYSFRRGGAIAKLMRRLFRPDGQLEGEIVKFDQSFRAFLSKPRPVFLALLISVTGLFWEIAQIVLVLYFLHVWQPIRPAIGIYVGESIPGIAPVPGGIGFRETGATLASALLGSGGSIGLAAVLLLRIRDLATLAIGGIFSLGIKFLRRLE